MFAHQVLSWLAREIEMLQLKQLEGEREGIIITCAWSHFGFAWNPTSLVSTFMQHILNIIIYYLVK